MQRRLHDQNVGGGVGEIGFPKSEIRGGKFFGSVHDVGGDEVGSAAEFICGDG